MHVEGSSFSSTVTLVRPTQSQCKPPKIQNCLFACFVIVCCDGLFFVFRPSWILEIAIAFPPMYFNSQVTITGKNVKTIKTSSFFIV